MKSEQEARGEDGSLEEAEAEDEILEGPGRQAGGEQVGEAPQEEGKRYRRRQHQR